MTEYSYLVFLGSQSFHCDMSFKCFDTYLPRCYVTSVMILAEAVTDVFETKLGFGQGAESSHTIHRCVF